MFWSPFFSKMRPNWETKATDTSTFFDYRDPNEYACRCVCQTKRPSDKWNELFLKTEYEKDCVRDGLKPTDWDTEQHAVQYTTHTHKGDNTCECMCVTNCDAVECLLLLFRPSDIPFARSFIRSLASSHLNLYNNNKIRIRVWLCLCLFLPLSVYVFFLCMRVLLVCVLYYTSLRVLRIAYLLPPNVYIYICIHSV